MSDWSGHEIAHWFKENHALTFQQGQVKLRADLETARAEVERLQMTLDEANDIAFAEHATVVRLTNNLEREKVLREALKAVVRYSKTTAGPHMAPYMAEIAVRALAQHPDTP